MALETATYIDGLVITNPTGTDSRSTSDDHHRLIKAAIKRTWPNVAGEVSASHGALNFVTTLSANAQTQLNGKLPISATALTANSALYAVSATNAVSSIFATSATNATSAVFATSATNATSAVFATSATNAASAARATSSARATSAVYANSAAYAVSAARASSAIAFLGSISAGQVPNASIGGQGVAEFGTTAEYAAGTDLTRMISLGTLGRPRNITQDGYITLPGGVVLQWGSELNVGSGSTISFPTAFGGVPWSVTVTWRGTAVGGEDTVGVSSTSSTGFTITHNDMGGAGADWFWMAIGPA